MKNPQPDGPNLIASLYRSVFARSDRGAAQRDDYFTPRLADADAELRALAARIKGSYRRGALTWSAFAKPQPETPQQAAEAFWGRGSRVRKTMHGFEIEVAIGAQTLGTRDPGQGPPSKALVLTPGITVQPVSSRLRHQPGVSWSADEEAATGADRLRLLRDHEPAAALAREALPPALANARQRLTPKAARITCTSDRVFVIGAPLPRNLKDPADVGLGDFDVPTLIELIERTRALAHALTT